MVNEIIYSGHRFSPEIIQQAIWLYVRLSKVTGSSCVSCARTVGMLFWGRDTAIPPVPSPTSAHSSFNLQISVSLAFCPQDGRVQFTAEDENGSDHIEKDECDHHRPETRVGGDIIARELGKVGAEGNARRDP